MRKSLQTLLPILDQICKINCDVNCDSNGFKKDCDALYCIICYNGMNKGNTPVTYKVNKYLECTNAGIYVVAQNNTLVKQQLIYLLGLMNILQKLKRPLYSYTDRYVTNVLI